MTFPRSLGIASAAGLGLFLSSCMTTPAEQAPQPDISLRPYSIYGSNMVLQREKPIRIAGLAVPGREITLTFADQAVTVRPDGRGEWNAYFPAMKAGGPWTLAITDGKDTVTMTDILIGEVWLASGQSNMEWPMTYIANAKEEIANADYPRIRFFNGSSPVNSYKDKSRFATPQDNIDGARWRVCNPSNVYHFVAVGYFFARALYQELKIPVGVVAVACSGSSIEPWISLRTFDAFPGMKMSNMYPKDATPEDFFRSRIPGTPQHKAAQNEYVGSMAAWVADSRKKLDENQPLEALPPPPKGLQPFGKDNYFPCVYYNTMIHPLRTFTFRGAIWYQGCSNLGDPGSVYKEKMKALAYDFRTLFDNPKFPVYYVQIAPFVHTKSKPFQVPWFWTVQQQFADEDPYAKMAVVNDIGELNNIHPKNKQDVGKRLSLLALKYEYGKNIVADSPFYKSHTVRDDRLIVEFRNAKQLNTRDGKAPDWFEIAGEDGVFLPANASIDGNKVILTNEKVAHPCFARFAWHQTAEPNLRNEGDLQAGAFQTGTPAKP